MRRNCFDCKSIQVSLYIFSLFFMKSISEKKMFRFICEFICVEIGMGKNKSKNDFPKGVPVIIQHTILHHIVLYSIVLYQVAHIYDVLF